MMDETAKQVPQQRSNSAEVRNRIRQALSKVEAFENAPIPTEDADNVPHDGGNVTLNFCEKGRKSKNEIPEQVGV
jgi:hypothetical protein